MTRHIPNPAYPALDALAFPGAPILTHGDRGCDEARKAWNLAADQQPAAIALPRSPGEVVSAVNWAEVAEWAAQHGLAALAGSSPDGGVAG